jgi:uncharacterized protein YbjT (DUF2867 family)
MNDPINQPGPIAVTGATGKVGSRVAARLAGRGVRTRLGCRSANPSFDWSKPDTWPLLLDGASAAFVSYYPDLGAVGGAEAIGGRPATPFADYVTRTALTGVWETLDSDAQA